jgi:competence protein ComEC
MRAAILAFAAGILWLQCQPELPATPILAAIAAAGGALVLLPRLSPHLRLAVPIGALLLGVAWAGGLAQLRLDDALAEANEGRDLAITGVIAGMPQRFDRGQRFLFDVESAPAGVPSRISLAWFADRRFEADDPVDVPSLAAGERWRLMVRLKRPHANLNPNAFDFEAWFFEQDIRATGWVRRGEARLDEFVPRFSYVVEHMRQRIRARFDTALPSAPYVGILVALAVGDQQAIEPDLWQVFARTGVTHLLSVSGLHVTMVAGLAAWFASWLWRRSRRLPLRLPAQKVAALAGFLAALIYCLLAGFAVPAQRTLYMLTVVALALWTGRTTVVSRVLGLALLLVLLLDPWAVLSAGFWLSFGAVGVLFYVGAGRLGEGHWLAAWGRAQWAVTVGMLPALLALFQQFSLASPIANAVAIPLVSLVVTPLALLGALPLTDPLLWLAHWLTAMLMIFLNWLAASNWAMWQQHAPPAWAVVLGTVGTGWMLLPRGFPARWLGLVALLPLLLMPPIRPAAGEAVVTVLDVGQGESVHVQTADHDLVYDTGPAFSADANSGNRIIVPYLRAAGVHRLDALVVSHEDKDHAGGAESVLAAIPTDLLLTSVPFEHPLSSVPVSYQPCRDGDAWEWDGVRFQMLHPPAAYYTGPLRKSNDMSCVLKVTSSHGSLLLTGDIEARVEAELVALHRQALRADVLVPPHHGSRSSSSPPFVEAVGAKTVLIPVGYRNPFGHPKAEVVERYAGSGAALHRTDLEGALTARFGVGGMVLTEERAERRRYWQGR